jgi:predicted nucleic acid-binding Zn ribbon protein
MFYSYRQRRAALRMTLNLALIAALVILLGVPAQF